MRPKKVIQLVYENEQLLSTRRFLLETRGYRVVAATTSQQAIEILARTVPGTLDLLVTDLLLQGFDGNELVRRAKLMHFALPTLIVSIRVEGDSFPHYADAFLPKSASSAAELLERVKLLTAKKRGPKKHVLAAALAAGAQRAREVAA